MRHYANTDEKSAGPQHDKWEKEQGQQEEPKPRLAQEHQSVWNQYKSLVQQFKRLLPSEPFEFAFERPWNQLAAVWSDLGLLFPRNTWEDKGGEMRVADDGTQHVVPELKVIL